MGHFKWEAFRFASRGEPQQHPSSSEEMRIHRGAHVAAVRNLEPGTMGQSGRPSTFKVG